MPIVTPKPKRDNRTTVEALLDAAKAKLIAKLTPEQKEEAWFQAVKEGTLLPTEEFDDIPVTALFPLASKFAGPPVNSATYATARRALLADYEILMQSLKTKKKEPQCP
jgi:hypothetical protein